MEHNSRDGARGWSATKCTHSLTIRILATVSTAKHISTTGWAHVWNTNANAWGVVQLFVMWYGYIMLQSNSFAVAHRWCTRIIANTDFANVFGAQIAIQVAGGISCNNNNQSAAITTLIKPWMKRCKSGHEWRTNKRESVNQATWLHLKLLVPTDSGQTVTRVAHELLMLARSRILVSQPKGIETPQVKNESVLALDSFDKPSVVSF